MVGLLLSWSARVFPSSLPFQFNSFSPLDLLPFANRVLEAARGSQLETLLTVALATGMRRGELLGLKWRDITLEMGSLQVARSMDRVAGHGVVESEPKTAQGRRRIALAPFAVEVLKQHRIHQLEARLKAGPNWNEHDLVFCNVYGNFLHPFRLYTMFHKVLTDADLPHMHFHDLRHSAATILLAMGSISRWSRRSWGTARSA
jgi:integrase